jgi:hypothetical protein
MKSHGQPSRYVKCGWCRQPLKARASEIKRRHALFCTRRCYLLAWRDYLKTYAERRDEELKTAA